MKEQIPQSGSRDGFSNIVVVVPVDPPDVPVDPDDRPKPTKVISTTKPDIEDLCYQWETHPDDKPARGVRFGEGPLELGVEPKGTCEYIGADDRDEPVLIAHPTIDDALSGSSDDTGDQCCCHCPCYTFDSDLRPDLGPPELALVHALPYEMDDYPGRIL